MLAGCILALLSCLRRRSKVGCRWRMHWGVGEAACWKWLVHSVGGKVEVIARARSRWIHVGEETSRAQSLGCRLDMGQNPSCFECNAFASKCQGVESLSTMQGGRSLPRIMAWQRSSQFPRFLNSRPSLPNNASCSDGTQSQAKEKQLPSHLNPAHTLAVPEIGLPPVLLLNLSKMFVCST